MRRHGGDLTDSSPMISAEPIQLSPTYPGNLVRYSRSLPAIGCDTGAMPGKARIR